MARSQETFGKKEKEKKRLKKRQDKLLKREERKANAVEGGLDTMMAYVDENGMITTTPPDPNAKKKKIKAENIEIGVPKRVDIPADSVRRGRVAFFNDQKGFGFINEIDSDEKYFVHVNGLIEEIKEGDTVCFELERGMKGMNAVQVKKIDLKAILAAEAAAAEAAEAEEDEDEDDDEDEKEETAE